VKFSIICSVYRREDFERWVLPAAQLLTDDIVEVATKSNLMAALNRGTLMARHRVKVYIHDDVEILEPKAFRAQLEAALQDPSVGMVGAIGSTTLDRVPWWHEPTIWGWIRHGRNHHLVSEYGNPVLVDAVEVKAVDGICYATTNDLWLPEETYRGFHFYDMEASLLMAKRCKKRVVVAPWRLHHHFSKKHASSTADFIQSAQVFAARWGVGISDQDWSWMDPEKLAQKPRFWKDGGVEISAVEAEELYKKQEVPLG